jgi:hypothetical protein
MKRTLTKTAVLIALFFFCNTVSALAVLTPVCDFVANLNNAIAVIGASLVLLMLVYAAVKWIYSSDDPGGRKQAVSIIVNALIGGIIMILYRAIIYNLFNYQIYSVLGGIRGVCPSI